eukprot:363586_1
MVTPLLQINAKDLISKDIVGIIYVIKNDCDLALTSRSSFVGYLNVTSFLFSGCVSHIIFFTMSLVVIFIGIWNVGPGISNHNNWMKLVSCLCCIYLFYLYWSIVGFVLYFQMDFNTSENKECGDIVLSWSILMGIEVVLAPCCLWLSRGFHYFFRHDL